MIRTLHVIDQPGETGEALVLRLSVDAARKERQGEREQHAWLLFGGEATRDAARAAGLGDDQYCLSPRPTGLHRLLPIALAQPKRLMHQAHRVMCWTEGAAQVASMLGCAHVVRRCADATLSPFAKRVIEHAYDDEMQAEMRESLRQRWGVDDGTVVVTLLADHLDAIDSSAAMLAMVFTYEALRALQPDMADVRLLCHPLAERRGEAALFGELLHLPDLLMQDAGVVMPWSVLPGCDMALAPMPVEAGLSILWANTMGVPVITPSDMRLPMLRELEHIVTARSAKPKDLADALTNWVSAHQPSVMSR